jgi:hypothetical protein
VLQVRLDRVDRDEHLGRDFRVGHHRRQEAKHRQLTLAQRLEQQGGNGPVGGRLLVQSREELRCQCAMRGAAGDTTTQQ